MWNLRNNIKEQTDQKQIHKYREQTDGCQMVAGGRDWRAGVKVKKVESTSGRYKTVMGM